MVPRALRRTAATLRHELKILAGPRPWAYDLLFRWRPAYRDLIVTDTTDVCIEGFPRSANSFAVGAFRYAQSGPVEISHHNHMSAPVLQAVRRAIPTLVLIRDPVDAVVSFRGLQFQNQVRSGRTSDLAALPYASLLRRWLGFYHRLRPVRDRVVVAPFEAVIDDFGRVIDAVNDRWRTDFRRFDHRRANVKAVREQNGYHALPSDERDTLKAKARRQFADELGEAHALVHEARDVHHEFLSDATWWRDPDASPAEHAR